MSSLVHEADRIRASGALGDGRIRDLFDYLAKRSTSGESPKEIEIAIDVFGKNADFDVSQDALARVYVSKLRRALQTYYQAHAPEGGAALQIPRGSYRMVIAAPAALPSDDELDEVAGPDHAVPGAPPAIRRRLTPYLIVAALAALLGFLAGVPLFHQRPTDLDLVRRSIAWNELVTHDRPILGVVGDYYMFGELDASSKVKRLIREPEVNSKSDLDMYRSLHGGAADQFKDIGSRYLPTSIASALRNIVPILTEDSQAITMSGRSFALSLNSDMTADTIKYADVVYVGYLSGLASLEPVVFSKSRFAIGSSHDELVDVKTSQRYASETESQSLKAPRPAGSDPSYHDYGYFSQFRGPGGNIIVVIAGTRDEGVRQTAEVFTNLKQLEAIKRQWHLTDGPFEALLDVQAVNGVNLSSKVIYAGAR